ncbi:GNAT family N-acetyltransferase [Paenibacillus sp. MCAF20]
MNPIFTIDCKDIYLREYQLEDLDELHALTMQPEIHTFLPDWNVPKEQRADWIANYEIPENKQFLKTVEEGRPIHDIRLRLGIIHKETGAFIGWCCTGPKEELPEPNREIMYALSKDYRGKGYATQAASGLIHYLFTQAQVTELHALALTHNTGSIGVILRCGFTPAGQIEIDGERFLHYTLKRH